MARVSRRKMPTTVGSSPSRPAQAADAALHIRQRHGELLVPVYEADPDGRPVVHHRVVDTIGRMLRNDSISIRDVFSLSPRVRLQWDTSRQLARMEAKRNAGAY